MKKIWPVPLINPLGLSVIFALSAPHYWQATLNPPDQRSITP